MHTLRHHSVVTAAPQARSLRQHIRCRCHVPVVGVSSLGHTRPLYQISGSVSNSSSSISCRGIGSSRRLTVSHAVYQQHQQRTRQLIIAAAGRRKTAAGEQQPVDQNSPEALSKLSVAELREKCQDLNLPSAGKKAELVTRLAEYLQGGSAAAAAAGAGGDAFDAGDEDITDAGVGADTDISLEELVAELQNELQTYQKKKLVECLADRGLPTTGSKPELVTRLATAVAEESMAADDGPVIPQQQPVQQQEQALLQQPVQPPAGVGGVPSSASEREWLLADKQQYFLDELLGVEGPGGPRKPVDREELVEILREAGQEVSDDEAFEELAERASWLLAEEEVLLMEQTGSAAAASEALADSPSSILDKYTATDINKMKVEELRSILRQLGLSDDGGRYVLRDRLMTMMVVRRAATAGDMDHLLQQLSQMTLGELRTELERRGLDLSGSKAALEMRLAQALVVEIVGPDAAGAVAAGLGQEQEEVEEIENPLLQDYDELLTGAFDPAVTVALICGTAAADSSSSSSSNNTAARLQKLAEALATANTLIDELHTAPLDEKQAAALAEAAATAAADSSTSSKEGKGSRKSKTSSKAAEDEQQQQPTAGIACGITVDIYWSNDGGAVYQLPRTALTGLAPADAAAQLPALATASFPDAAALAKHLKASGTHAALSMLPGGALALAGKLTEACAAAGVPLAGRPAFEGTTAALRGKQGPVTGRSAVLRELKGLGYNTLPVLEVSRAEVEAATDDLNAWMGQLQEEVFEGLVEAGELAAGEIERELGDKLMSDDELVALEQETAAEVAAAAEAGETVAVPPPPSSSQLLQDWTNQRGPDSQAAEQQQEQEQQQQPEQAVPAFAQKVIDWCVVEGIHVDNQVFTLGNAAGGDPLATAKGLPSLVMGIMSQLADDPSLTGLLIEPLYRKLSRWEVVVLATPEDGPVALLPAEVEQYSVAMELADADLALQEWQMMQAGIEEEDISATLDSLAATEPISIDILATPNSPDPLPRHTLKLHMPPRASTKISQTIRHTAAKAVAQLGLESAGLVRVGGWMALQPDWQERYVLPPEAIQKMPDFDAGQLERMHQDELARRATELLPLADYCDDIMHMPDLTAFDPAQRCQAEGNGEGDVLVSTVDLNVPLASTSLAGLQAAELGLSAGGIARHLINLSLMRHDVEPLLPPPPPPPTGSSAQWSHVTGVNDSLQDIALQLAEAAEERREAIDHAEERAAVEASRKQFAALSFDEAVEDVLAGLTTQWMTQAELMAPPQEPEEWEPEFDPRTQEEIHAERDAGRLPEDLAAREMRDENLWHYGDQPIRYDRWGTGEDWVPPAIAAAQAAAEGKPVLTVTELQEQEDQKQEQRRQQLLNTPFSEEDRLPEVTEDEVIYGRLLERDLYKGGVRASIERRAKQGPGPATGTGDGDNDSSTYGLTLPAVEEVYDEAETRRPAPRVWVLVGGDGTQRQQALRSGANIATKLQRCCDLQVDVFLLPPAGAGLDETKRRAALLARRTEWRALGIPENLFPSSMKDDELVHMPFPTSLENREVIVIPPQHLARHTVEEAAEAAERASARARVSYHAAHVLEKQQMDSQFESQLEVDAYYVQGVGSGWGAGPAVLPPVPRFMRMEDFLSEAAACDATIILAATDSSTESGQLQQLFELHGIGYTGMSSDFAFKCSNRLALTKGIDGVSDALAAQAGCVEGAAEDEEGSSSSSGVPVGLHALPKKVLKTADLVGFLDRPEGAAVFEGAFDDLLDGWDTATALAVKPPTHSGGLGPIRISSPQDFAVLAQALQSGVPRLPVGSLENQQLPVTLPLQTPDMLLVEPWIDTDSVAVSAGPDGKLQVEWAGSSRWVEVTIGLLGELGCMTAMQPTLIAYAADGSRHQITPPPQHILPAAAIEAAQGYAVAVADGLGLRSIACVDGFVNVDSGELVVMDVQAAPSLADGSPLLQQAMLLDPPLLPYQLFRQLARQAYITNQQAMEAAAAGITSMSSAYYSAPAEPGAAGLGAEDFDLGSGVAEDLGGDIFAGAPGGFGGDDDGELGGGGVEDEDLQGMAAGWTRQ